MTKRFMRSLFMGVALMLVFAALRGIAEEGPIYYPIPGGTENHIVFSDGTLYLLTPSEEEEQAKYEMNDIYAYDPSSPTGFRPILPVPMNIMDRPFFLNGAVYVLPHGGRVMHLLDETKDTDLPKAIELLPESAFPLGKPGDPWDEPLPDLLSVTHGDIIEYIVWRDPGEVRTLCHLNTATGKFKSMAIGPGLMSFSPVDEKSTLYYAMDETSTKTRFYHVRLIDWDTGEVTSRGELPEGTWSFAYDAATDSVLYTLKGTLYRYDSVGQHTVLADGLPERSIDQRGFVMADRTLVTYVSGDSPHRLMVVKLPDAQP